jgi:hypothetical protein
MTISHTFARHLDGVGVPELAWSETPADACSDGRPPQMRAGGGARPRSAAAGRTVDDAEEWPDGQFDSELEPGLQFFPAPRVHSQFAAAAALATVDKQRAAAVVQVGFGERERFLDSWPCAPQDHNQAAQSAAVRAGSRDAHDGDDFLDFRWIGRVTQAFVAWRAAGVESRHGCRRPTSTSTIEQQLGHDPS